MKYVSKNNLFSEKDHLLVAVSGGVDSVVLCELLQQAELKFSIAHCNFQLRGVESERDEKFVTNLATKYNVPFFVKKFDTEKYATENKMSIQVAARELRYEWFNEIVTSFTLHQTSYIATAHHANDSTETMLMNFFKGTGIKGLHGILPKQQNIVRPLLFATKEEIKQFATEHHLDFVEDSSNESDKYTRNFFRNTLLPQIEDVFPKVQQNLQKNIERFTEVEIIYNNFVEQTKQKLCEVKGDEIHIPILKLKKSSPLKTVFFEILNEYNFTASQTDEALKLLDSETGKYISSTTHRLLKNRNWLIISPLETIKENIILIEENNSEVFFEKCKLQIEKIPNYQLSIFNSQLIAQLDFSKVKFPLLLRKWKTGDYFYPLGMKKKKKLNRFFIDNKLSLTQKEKTWVVESNKHIIWVVGMRIDERFKVTNATKDILEIKIQTSDVLIAQ